MLATLNGTRKYQVTSKLVYWSGIPDSLCAAFTDFYHVLTHPMSSTSPRLPNSLC